MLDAMLDVKVAAFDGPLDLLLTLVERRELDVTAVALVEVIEQYLAHLRAAPSIEPDALSDLITIGARLIYLKSVALLPRPAAPPVEDGGDDESAEDLEAMLREYRRYKAAAREFREREEQGLRSFPRLAPAPPVPPGPGLDNVTLDRLVVLVQEALRRRPPDPPAAVPREIVTVRERLAALECLLERDGRASFIAFIAAARTRIEVVVSFMAVLELIKSGRAAAEQLEPFGDITIISLTVAAPAAD